MTPSPTDPDVLSELSLFQGVPAQELEKFAPLLHRKIFPAGATVITADQLGDAVYVISAGSVKVHVIRPDGEEVILAVLGPGEVVGEMSLADSLGRSADVSTLEESVLLWMHRSAFRMKLEEVPMLSPRNLASLLSRRVRLTNAHLLSLAALDVPGRVASQLLALAREYGESTPQGTRVPMRLTQSDLAGLAGASRVRVNQALGYFRKRGLISMDREGHFTVRDEDALARRTR
jgi:CRP/FNR family transcriptional regulator, cyclic AMP receptor protein